MLYFFLKFDKLTFGIRMNVEIMYKNEGTLKNENILMILRQNL